MERNSKVRSQGIAAAIVVLLISWTLPGATASQCNINGPHYRLASDTVDWSMRIGGGQNCSLDFQLNTILSSSPGNVEIKNVKLISSPQSGQVVIRNEGFSFTAEPSFKGKDSFTVQISGAINKIQGNSIIHVAVTNPGGVSTLPPHSILPTPNPLPQRPATPTASNAPPKSTAVANSDWSSLKIGAGGNIDGMSIAPDGALVVRTDTFGAYKWNPSALAPNGTLGTWEQLVTATSMPSTFTSAGQNFNDGVYEIQIAPSNSSIMYMETVAYTNPFGTNTQATVYKSTNGGRTWIATNFGDVQITCQNDSNGPTRNYGPRIAIDPTNPDHVLVGTGNNGLFVSFDGANFAKVSTSLVPQATGDGSTSCSGVTPLYPGYTGMVFNPSNANDVFVFSFGNGVYGSTDGGTTWTHLTKGTGPTGYVGWGAVDPHTGFYFVIEANGVGNGLNLWRWNGTTWTKLLVGGGGSTNNIQAVAVDPFNPGHIVAITPCGNIAESTNSGGTFSVLAAGGPIGGVSENTVGDIPWMTSLGCPGISEAAYFDFSGTNRIYASAANGFWSIVPWTTGTIGGTSNLTWNSQARGIEQLVSVEILASPNYSSLFVGNWDRAIFNPDLASYPSTIYPFNDTTLRDGWSVDYASSNPSVICAAVNGSAYFNNIQASGCTSNGTSWRSFPAYPSNAYPKSGGAPTEEVAVSTPDNIIFATTGQQPHYTTDATASATWTAITCPGVSSWSNFLPASPFGGFNSRVIAADRVTPNQFYMYIAGVGFFILTNSGATCVAGAAIAAIPGNGGGFNKGVQIHTVPGQASNFWVSVGNGGNPGGPPDTVPGLGYSTDGGKTINPVTNMVAALSVGFGAAANGQTYPAVYTAGWFKTTSSSTNKIGTGSLTFTVPSGLSILPGTAMYLDDNASDRIWGTVTSYSGSTLVINGVTAAGSGSHSSWELLFYGVWQCTVACTSSSPAWTEIAGWPNNSFDAVNTISGDPNVFDRVYLGFTGSGYVKINYLLNRDLDPASNDNDPAFIDCATG